MSEKTEYIKNKIKKYYQEKKIQDYYEKQIKKRIEYKNIQQDYTLEETKYSQKKYKIKETYQLKNRDIIFRIIQNLNKRIEGYKFKSIFSTSDLNHEKLLGCSIEEFKKYLESLFKDGMTFDNYPEWEVDHIIPLSSIDFNNYDEVKKVLHYTNLQPLWLKENRSKGSKTSA